MQFEMDVPDQLKGKIHFALGWLLEVLLSAKHLFTLKSTAHPSPPTPNPRICFKLNQRLKFVMRNLKIWHRCCWQSGSNLETLASDITVWQSYLMSELGIQKIPCLCMYHSLWLSCAPRSVQQKQDIFTVHWLWLTLCGLFSHLLRRNTIQCLEKFTYAWQLTWVIHKDIPTVEKHHAMLG